MKDLERLARVALEPVNRDLVRTGYGHLQVIPMDPGGLGGIHTRYFAGLEGRGCYTGEDNSIGAEMSEADMVQEGAISASNTLMGVLHLQWPVCAEHGGEPMTVFGLRWVCGKGHAVAAVGELQAAMVEPPK